MKYNKGLREIVAAYDHSNSHYMAILYVGLEGSPRAIEKMTKKTSKVDIGMAAGGFLGGALGAGLAGGVGAVARIAFSIMTVNDNHLCFYLLNRWSFSLDNIENKTILPFSSITKLKIRKFLIWTTLKIRFTEQNKTFKLNIKISDKVLKIGSQSEESKKMLDYFRTKNVGTN